MKEEIGQRINRSYLSDLLKSKGLNQKTLAERLGENEKSFSRWLTQEEIPSRLVWNFRKELNLKSEEMKILLMVPEFKVFFRRKFLTEVPTDIKSKAVGWARTFLDLSSLHASKKFIPMDLSNEKTPEDISEKIKNLLKIPPRITLDTLICALREQGVEVAFVPFGLLAGLDANSETKEDAFSVTDGKRCCIFVDTQLSRDKAPFVIAHELAHLFRVNKEIDKAEEKFCNRIAGEIVFPREYFDTNRKLIESVLVKDNLGLTIHLIDEIKKDIGGEFWGIVLHLKDLEYISPKGKLWGKLNQMGKHLSGSAKTIHSNFFKDFDVLNFEKQKKFWLESDLQSFPEYIFFSTISRAIQLDKMTPRSFAEIFTMDLSIADEIASILRYRFKEEVGVEIEGFE